MNIKFTEEAQLLWDKLTEEEQRSWTTNRVCGKCQAEYPIDEFNGSIFEGQLALFHRCTICDNKEVRLIDPDQQTQAEIDDDFNRWLESKKKSHPDAFKK